MHNLLVVVLLTDCMCLHLDAVSCRIPRCSWCVGSLRSVVIFYGMMQACTSALDVVSLYPAIQSYGVCVKATCALAVHWLFLWAASLC